MRWIPLRDARTMVTSAARRDLRRRLPVRCADGRRTADRPLGIDRRPARCADAPTAFARFLRHGPAWDWRIGVGRSAWKFLLQNGSPVRIPATRSRADRKSRRVSARIRLRWKMTFGLGKSMPYRRWSAQAAPETVPGAPKRRPGLTPPDVGAKSALLPGRTGLQKQKTPDGKAASSSGIRFLRSAHVRRFLPPRRLQRGCARRVSARRADQASPLSSGASACAEVSLRR